MTVPNHLDEVYQYPSQDPQDPVWAADADIAEMQRVDDPNDLFDTRQPVTIRKADGAQDFLNEIVEHFGEIVGVNVQEPQRRKKPRLDVISVKQMGADKWRGSNHMVGSNPVKIATESPCRRRIELYNRGSNPAVGAQHAYISSLPAVADGPNTRRLAFDAFLYNPMVLFTKDDVYAICIAGETTIIDVIEEFDLEE